jgi:hypothetical protein
MISYHQLLAPGDSSKVSPDILKMEMESFGLTGTKAYDKFSQIISRIKSAREHSAKILSAKTSKSSDSKSMRLKIIQKDKLAVNLSSYQELKEVMIQIMQILNYDESSHKLHQRDQ